MLHHPSPGTFTMPVTSNTHARSAVDILDDLGHLPFKQRDTSFLFLKVYFHLSA
jgi:hypothetical protein